MSKPVFPEAYIGAGKRFGTTPGADCWDRERALSIARREQDLPTLHDATRPERPITYQARATNQHQLALLYAWEGRADEAKKLMAGCLATTQAYFHDYWPDIRPDSCCRLAIEGALAAALIDQPEAARALFTHAAHFSAGLITGQEDAPLSSTSHPMSIINNTLIQAYSRLRLGQLAGFRALLYPPGFPEAVGLTKAPNYPPVLCAGSVADLFQTIETANAVGRAKREDTGMIWNHIKFLVPVLRTLYAYLQAPTQASAGSARKALAKYYEMIRSLADFPVIYLRVLDLQKAYPQVYGGIVPSVFE